MTKPSGSRSAARPLLLLAATLLLAGALAPPPALGQDPARGRATIAGRVIDAGTLAPIPGATVSVEGTQVMAIADSSGRYVLRGVPVGPQVLRAEMFGFAATRVPLTVPPQGVLIRDFSLAESALQVEGITVTADAVGRARGELATASVIDREAIAHQTATSLSGLLELLPGVPLQPPGIEGVQQISLRAVPTTGGAGADPGAGALGSLGTLIIVDGVPLSNNANLQTTGARGELRPPSSSGGGIDLRQLPASMIERIEVIRGIPSARFGDLTQGAVLVETRAGAVPPAFTGLYDARTRAGSLIGGARAFDRQSGTLNLDVTRTRSVGLSEAWSERLAGQLSHRAWFGRSRTGQQDGRLMLDTRVDLFEVQQERPEQPEINPGSSSRGLERGLRVSERLRYELPREVRLDWTAAFSYRSQSAHDQARLNRGAMPFTSRVTEGRAIGHFVGGSYAARAQLEGEPRSLYQRLELTKPVEQLGFEHLFRVGVEASREWNAGAGYIFDMEFPPQVRFNGVNGFDRPRPFNEIPPLVNTAIYVDDYFYRVLPGNMLLNLQAGLRLDVLHEGSHWFSGARDLVAQPRFNAELAPLPDLRFRAGWGRTAKLPTLAQLFPARQFYDVINVNWYAPEPSERLAVLTTFIRDPSNPDLGFARASKAEAGVEAGLGGGAAVGLTAFSDRINGAVGIRPDPIFLLRDRYQLSDSAAGTGRPPELIEPPFAADTVPVILDRPANNLFMHNRGLELTATLPELRLLRTRLQVQGARVRTDIEKRDIQTLAGFLSDFQLNPSVTRMPYWDAPVRTGLRTILTYRLIHHQPEVGLVVTGTIQHYVQEEQLDVGGTDTLAFAGYMTRDGQLVPVPPERRGDAEFRDLRRTRTGLLTARRPAPSDWLASLQVSKTLPLSGRLSFYAFNALDRVGTYVGATSGGRLYPPVRFGLDVTMPAGALRELWR
jgi:outer membrane receptor protein involved in Fe transport